MLNRLAVLIATLLATATPAGAQPPFSIVTGFKAQQTVTPHTLVLASDGNFYGTTSFGGAFDQGTLFRMTPGGIVTILHEFAGRNDGGQPLNLIQAADGNLYGPAFNGGEGCGTVFRATLSGTVTTLHTFSTTGGGYLEGCGPNVLVQALDGNLYGTAASGGTPLYDGYGTLFRMSLDGGFDLLFNFSQYGMAFPHGMVTASSGVLYGITSADTGVYIGAVFSVSMGGSPSLTSLSLLTALTNVGINAGALVQATNRYFFVAVHNTIYRMTTDGRSTIVHELTGMNGEGSFPNGSMVVASDGNVYGTTTYGGDGPDFSGHGTVFKIAPNGAVSTVYAFTGGSDGAFPSAGLTIGPDGQLYGTTDDGVNHGTIFRLTLDGHLTTLARAFAGGLTGAHPMAELVEGADGFLYGTTSDGGTDNLGAVFQLGTDGTTGWLHYFKGADGAAPNAALLQSADGAFYSTTAEGGASGLGTVFRLQTDGTFGLLHSFTGTDGAHPYAALVRSGDGNSSARLETAGATTSAPCSA